MNAIFRIAFLLFLAVFAATSNITHAAFLPLVPVTIEHGGHHTQPADDEREAPCCEDQTCIGCAVPTVALALQDRGEILPFADRAVFVGAMLVNRHTVPDPPPPRIQS